MIRRLLGATFAAAICAACATEVAPAECTPPADPAQTEIYEEVAAEVCDAPAPEPAASSISPNGSTCGCSSGKCCCTFPDGVESCVACAKCQCNAAGCIPRDP